jgi:hypothetical protein
MGLIFIQDLNNITAERFLNKVVAAKELNKVSYTEKKPVTIHL